MNLIFWGAALGAGGALVAVVWAVARELVGRARHRRIAAQAARVRALLEEARAKEYDGLDKLLFDMRDTYDASVVEDQLREMVSAGGRGAPALVHGFKVLGITDRYLAAVRSARSWEQRALAAAMLGVLGEVRAVKPLIEALHDTREDPDVKLACAEALGRIRDPAVIPLLIEELERVDEWSSPRLGTVLMGFGEAAVEPLLAALSGAPSLNVRVWAAQVLGKIGDARALPHLLARVHDRVDSMRMSVANALGDLRDPRAVRSLIDAILRDPSPTVRAQAATALGRIGDPSSLPLLIAALGDLEHWVRLRALEAIEATSPTDMSPIEAALGDANRDVRYRAALALERLGALEQAFGDLASEDPIRAAAAQERLVAVGRAGLSERLNRHVQDKNPTVRARIVTIFGELGDVAHAPSVIARLRDDDAAVRRAALDALGALGAHGRAGEGGAKSATATALVGVLRDGAAGDREPATAALLRHEPLELATVLTELIQLVGDERDDVRACVVRVLAVVPGEDVDAQLRAAVSDRFVQVQLAAVRALGARRVPVAEEIGPCLQASLEELRIAAANALGAIGGRRAIELLLGAMPHARDAYRDAVCEALAGFGWEAAYPTFDVLLASDDLASRLGVVWTLGKTGDVRAVPMLQALLHEPEARVRSAVAGAIGKIDDPRAIDALAEALADPSPFVRSASVNALGARAAPASLLAPLLADPDEFVRNRTAIALGRIGGGEADLALEAVPPGTIAPATIALARGLAGAEDGVAAALHAMESGALRRDLERRLAEEPPAVRAQFLATLQLDEPDGGALDVGVVVDRYVETLRNSSDVAGRRGAARLLGRLSGDRATECLASAVRHDPDAEVRQLAASALAHHADPIARGALLAAVQDPDSRVRLGAIRALGHDLAPREAGPLFAALASPSPEIVEAAEAALAAIHAAPDALSIVHDWMMAQESELLVCAGLRILARIADARSLRVVQALVQSPVSPVRMEAMRALAALGVPEGVRTMLAALDDPVAAVRVAVVASLRGVTRTDVVERLARAVVDPSAEVRAAVADTLATLETTQAAPLLAKLAADHDLAVRTRAVLALVALPDLEGLSRVIALWPSLPPRVWHDVRTGMASAIPRLEAMLSTALDPQARETAVQLLATVDATAHAERIARALEDPDGRVRLAAVRALVTLEPERVGDWLARVHDDPVAEVRTAARRGPWKLV